MVIDIVGRRRVNMAGARGHQASTGSRNREGPLLRLPILVPHLIPEDHRLLHRATLMQLPSPALRPHPALLEEHIAKQHMEIHSILLDNHRLASSHLTLKQELTAAHQQLCNLSATLTQVKADRTLHVQEVYERSLKMEEEVRSVDQLQSELDLVKSDILKISSERDDLITQLQGVNEDLARAREEARYFSEIKDEIEYMKHEVKRGRDAIEYEKVIRSSNEEQSRAMEKNMISMKHEIERLRPELANAEKRARAAAAAAAANQGPAYGSSFGNSDSAFGVNQFNSYYNMHPGGVESSGHGTFDIHRTNVH